MVQVRINGIDTSVRSQGLPRIADVIELAKTIIDPDHIIINALLDGRDLSDADWSASTTNHETSILELETDTVEVFCIARLSQAPGVFQACFVQFRDARKTFKHEGAIAGNKKLAGAVNTLHAALQWYDSFYQLLPQAIKAEFAINDHMNKIMEIAQRVCQHQLYQSWWALGQALEKELEPELDKLEDFARQYQKKIASLQPQQAAAGH